jgi:hypothetical protein
MLRGAGMRKNRSSLSGASSYKEIGEYWDTHDLTDSWGETRKVEFDVAIESERIYCAIEKSLSEKVHSIAREKGVSADTLINLWIQEKVQKQLPG